jgi:CHAD domain-containing protein
MDFSIKKFNKQENAKIFSKLFKAAGEIRDNFIILTIIKKYGIILPPAYILQIKKETKESEKKFRLLCDEDNLAKIKKLKKELLNELKEVRKKDFKAFLNIKGANISAETALYTKKEKKIHGFRIELKKYYNLLKMYQPKGKFPKLDALEEIIGHWHDTMITISYLKQIIQGGKLKGKKLSTLKIIISRIKKEKSIYLKRAQLLAKSL